MRLEVDIDGIEDVRKELAKATQEYEDALAAAQYEEALGIDAAAVRLTPVEFGFLRGSHYVAPPTTAEGALPQTEIGYGVDYAVPVHEGVEVFHKVGQPLFLATAVKVLSRGLLARMGRRTDRNVKLGIGIRALPKDAPARPKIPTAAKIKAAREKKRKETARRKAQGGGG